uniref:Uncharacterized protein n=1 Tax=Meloidogyne enterolobii TaxID=390850 RepID=A0A6V7VC17_MELEN|nr:unnamed protein product [Meloidogyne enterolobii]
MMNVSGTMVPMNTGGCGCDCCCGGGSDSTALLLALLGKKRRKRQLTFPLPVQKNISVEANQDTPTRNMTEINRGRKQFLRKFPNFKI